MRSFTVAFLSITLLLIVFSPTHARTPLNNEAPPEYVWDLTALYASDKEWQKVRENLLKELDEIAKLKGSITNSPDTLPATLARCFDAKRQVDRLYSYASMAADQDLRNTSNQELDQLATLTSTKLEQSQAWLLPEIQGLGEKRVRKLIKRHQSLNDYRYFLDNTLRTAPHTLNTKGEDLLALFASPVTAPQSIFSLLANSDINWPSIKMSDGKAHRIDSQGYKKWRQSAHRGDRKKAFNAFFGEWQKYRNSVGAVLNTHIQNQVALAKAKNYRSVLQRELYVDNLPEAVYRNLVSEVNRALPTLHRYFKLRAKLLGLEQLHYYDMYPPLVKLDKTFSFETSKSITLEAMSVLGDEWVNRQKAAMRMPWMHVYPQKGKRSGAYMNGAAYDVHPYLLLNHNDTYDALSTFAHEWGHAMHTLYAVESQPYPTYDYTTFIAEIPSTTLELILQNHMTKTAENVEEKLFYLGHGLESMRTTFFRQTMFAEFELALYESVERGEALTGKKISKIYGGILKRYHGHSEKIVVIDELYTNEWMFVPHFYYNMYVYQYATSITAGTELYQQILKEGKPAVTKYINLLRAGGSDYPHALLKNAGVDLTKPAPYRSIIKKMNTTMDEIEHLLEM